MCVLCFVALSYNRSGVPLIFVFRICIIRMSGQTAGRRKTLEKNRTLPGTRSIDSLLRLLAVLHLLIIIRLGARYLTWKLNCSSGRRTHHCCAQLNTVRANYLNFTLRKGTVPAGRWSFSLTSNEWIKSCIIKRTLLHDRARNEKEHIHQSIKLISLFIHLTRSHSSEDLASHRWGSYEILGDTSLPVTPRLC